MFWRFGGYASISTIDTLLDKPDVTLEELLDETDLIQELKQHNTKLIEFLRDENTLQRLLKYVVAPGPDVKDGDEDAQSPSNEKGKGKDLSIRTSPDTEKSDEEQEKLDKVRLKYAYLACEVLSSETWSILEALMANPLHLQDFWDFLTRPPPLDPLQAGYFTKVNETLLEKKTEEMLDFFKTSPGTVAAMLQHVDCPMVMDLLLKIISLEKAEGGQGIVDVRRCRDVFCASLLIWIFIVAAITRSDSNPAFLSCPRFSIVNTDVGGRFPEGHHYHIRQRIPERAILHRTKQSHQAARLGALHGIAHHLNAAWRQSPNSWCRHCY
jgi:SIT4-associating protein SAP185/190